MIPLVKPPVLMTADDRCAYRVAHKSFCRVCAYRPTCWFLAQEGLSGAEGSPGFGKPSAPELPV